MKVLAIPALLLISINCSRAHADLMYISAKPITCVGYAYEIEITQYAHKGSSVIFSGLEIIYGDGNLESIRNDDFEYHVVEEVRTITKYTKRHVFQRPGVYQINARFFNRMTEIQNMVNSVHTPFYVGTVVHIDPYLGCNATPRLENLPMPNKSGTNYFYDFSFVDDENDSLSFHFTTPLQDHNIPVIDYQLPFDRDSETQHITSRISLDPFNGSVLLNSKNLSGIYTVALKVNEWRKVHGTY